MAELESNVNFISWCLSSFRSECHFGNDLPSFPVCCWDGGLGDAFMYDVKSER